MTKNSKILLSFAIIIALGIFGFYLGSSPTQSQRDSIKIGYLTVVSSSPTYAAIEEGYFEAEGLPVELVPFRSSDLAIDSILDGDVDVLATVGLAQSLAAHAEFPEKVSIVGLVNSTSCLTYRPSQSETFEEFLSKSPRIAVFPGSVFPTWAKHALGKQYGQVSSRATLLPTSPPLQIEEFEQGNFDALFTLQPYCEISSKLEGVAYAHDNSLLANAIVGEDQELPGGAILVGSTILEDTALVSGIRSALDRGAEGIEDGTIDLPSLLSKYTTLDDSTAGDLVFPGTNFEFDTMSESILTIYRKNEELGLIEQAPTAPAILWQEK